MSFNFHLPLWNLYMYPLQIGHYMSPSHFRLSYKNLWLVRFCYSTYRVSSHSFRGNYFLFLIWKSKGHSTYGQRSQYINVWKYSREETIQGRKLYEEIWYLQSTWCDTCYSEVQHFIRFLGSAKGQLISKCPYEKSVLSKIPTKKFPRFLS